MVDSSVSVEAVTNVAHGWYDRSCRGWRSGRNAKTVMGIMDKLSE
jgi:hypothetical protein